MIAMARLLRALHGDAIRVVFIGPCIAKKREAISPDLGGEVDEALTFTELRRMLTERGLDLDEVAPGDFDPPHARGGGLFPISGGMLQVAGIHEDLVTGHVMVGEGPAEFAQAIKEAETGIMETRLLELLFCHGCTMGPGMSSDLPHFGRRARVSQFVRHRISSVDAGAWRDEHERWAGLDLARSYSPFDLRMPVPSPEELVRLLGELGKSDPRHELNCGACGYSSCRDLASAIYVGLAEPTMCLPHSIEQLRSTVRDLALSNEELASTQEALVQSEKLASMGQLAAGIAHEVNNPLGVVIMYAHFLMEQLGDRPEVREDVTMVVEQADRCKKIVAGLLNFARQNKVEHDRVNLVELAAAGASRRAAAGWRHPRLRQPDGGPAGRPGRRSAHPGAREPRQQRLRGHARRRGAHGHGQRRRPGERSVPPGGRRHGRRHPGRKHPEALRAVLHDQEGGPGHRPRPRGHLRHRQDAPRRHHSDLQRRILPGGPQARRSRSACPAGARRPSRTPCRAPHPWSAA